MRRVPVGMSASRDEHDTSEEGLQARQTERLDADQFSASADDRDTEPQTAGVRWTTVLYHYMFPGCLLCRFGV